MSLNGNAAAHCSLPSYSSLKISRSLLNAADIPPAINPSPIYSDSSNIGDSRPYRFPWTLKAPLSCNPSLTMISAITAASTIAAISALGPSGDSSSSLIVFLLRYLLPHSIANRTPAIGALKPAATPALQPARNK